MGVIVVRMIKLSEEAPALVKNGTFKLIIRIKKVPRKDITKKIISVISVTRKL